MSFPRWISYSVLILALFLAGSPDGNAQLVVAPAGTPASQVNLLTGAGVIVSNITRNCWGNGSGTFDASTTNIAVSDGVLLTTGSINNALGPNTGTGTGSDNFQPGDPDLTALAGVATFDACALEFDIVASCDTVSISYVFASEEYDEYVCGNVNDAFGFFISGPGVPLQNIALVPGTTTPVAINTVNNGTIGTFGSAGPGCILGNSSYFVTNNGGLTHEYDGMTVRLEAKTWVQPCSTYHIKLVVADGGDGIFDSGVFLEAGGIRCTSGGVTVNTAAVNGGNAIVEDCNDGVLYFERSGDLSTPLTINYMFGGTATNGTDYSTLPTSVTFPSGVDSIGLLITPTVDGITEGLETILVILNDTVCNTIFSDTAEIILSDPPNAVFAVNNGCENPVNFTNNSTFPGSLVNTWAWDFGDGTTSSIKNPVHTFPASGTYTVKLVMITPQGCRDSMTQTVIVYDPPVADFAISGFCPESPTSFTNLSTSGAGATITTRIWDFGDGNSSTDLNPVHTYATPGVYNVSLMLVNSNGCEDTLTVPITIYPLPVPDFSSNVVCYGTQTDFTDQSTVSTGNIASWAWDFEGNGTSALQNPGFVFPNPGTYQVQLVAGSDQGCLDSITQTVEIWPNPAVDFEWSQTCIGDSMDFTDLTDPLVGNLVSWDWDFGDGGTSNATNPSHFYTQVNVYDVTLTVMTDNGCMSSITLPVEVTPSPVVPIPVPDTICRGESAEIRALVPAGVRVDWYYDQTSTRPFWTGVKYQTQPLAFSQQFFMQAITDQGCKSPMVGNWIKVWNPPSVSMEVERELEIPTALAEFTVFNVFTSTSISSYFWDFGDGFTSGQMNPVHQYAEAGTYTVTLLVVDENGCEAFYEFPEWINVSQHIQMFIPNAFSPNGDGLNDEFFLSSRLITDFEIQIFDRWGKLMFGSEDMNFRWNGKDTGGEDAPEGVYAYKIQATGYDGKAIVRSGTITLMR